MIELANVCIKRQQDMSRTLVCVQKALDGEIFTCNVRENGGLASKVCQVLQGSKVLQGSTLQLKQAGSLFRGMGEYLRDADSEHDPLEESESPEEFNSKMFDDLFKNPHHFLFVEIDRTLVGYVDAHESRFGGYYVRHIFCNRAGLNIGKLLLALAEEKAFREAPETCVFLNFKCSEKLFRLYETAGFRIPIIEEHGIVRHALCPDHPQGMVKYIRSRLGENRATKTVEVGATDRRSEEPGPVSRRTDARYCINEDLSQTLQRILTLK
jgi:hypothetical protein